MKLGLISLGCAKNLIDSEMFLGVAKKYGLEITPNIKEADILVVNTCGFIESAKKEAIDTILEVLDYKSEGKIVVAMGCLVERYLDDLKKELPEVDFYFPIKDYKNIDNLFNQITNKKLSYKMDYKERVVTTSKYSAYLRIAEGCDNRCAYCAIPLIRGGYVSRDFDSIVDEAKKLALEGTKEITLIAQDTTRYGTDFKTKDSKRLNDLLHAISLIDGIVWIRVLYLYPDEITKEILDEFKNNPKVVKYFDIPIQHASNKMLKAMNRRGSKELLINHIDNIRKNIPNAIVRTTLITGFPTETEEDFIELKEFVEKEKFERLGCFTFSKEEDTPSYSMKPQVNSRTATRRRNEIMKLQEKISLNFNKSLIGKQMECLIEGYDYNDRSYYGRTYMYAPDDVDGKVYVYSTEPLNVGDIVKIEIIEASTYDLEAKFISK